MKKHLLILFLFVSTLPSISYAQQDTLRYIGLAGGDLIMNAFEFYPDKTFKYEWLFDMSRTEFGYYEQKADIFTLYFYESDIFTDKPPENKKVAFKKRFKMEKNRLYPLKKYGRKRKRIRLSVYSFWRNPFRHLFGVKYEIFRVYRSKNAEAKIINIIKD